MFENSPQCKRNKDKCLEQGNYCLPLFFKNYQLWIYLSYELRKVLNCNLSRLFLKVTTEQFFLKASLP